MRSSWQRCRAHAACRSHQVDRQARGMSVLLALMDGESGLKPGACPPKIPQAPPRVQTRPRQASGSRPMAQHAPHAAAAARQTTSRPRSKISHKRDYNYTDKNNCPASRTVCPAQPTHHHSNRPIQAWTAAQDSLAGGVAVGQAARRSGSQAKAHLHRSRKTGAEALQCLMPMCAPLHQAQTQITLRVCASACPLTA